MRSNDVAYLKETPQPKAKPESDSPYNPMPIRDYLLGLDIKDVNKIDKNLEALWPFTYLLVNTKTEERIKIVNKDPDNLLVTWSILDDCMLLVSLALG
jgi:hypothetical protein